MPGRAIEDRQEFRPEYHRSSVAALVRRSDRVCRPEPRIEACRRRSRTSLSPLEYVPSDDCRAMRESFHGTCKSAWTTRTSCRRIPGFSLGQDMPITTSAASRGEATQDALSMRQEAAPPSLTVRRRTPGTSPETDADSEQQRTHREKAHVPQQPLNARDRLVHVMKPEDMVVCRPPPRE